MTKPLDQMTDIELFALGATVLKAMCDSMADSHLRLAETLQADNNSEMAASMTRHSLRCCLEGVGCILNNIDLIDDAVADQSAPLFEELHRRYPRLPEPLPKESSNPKQLDPHTLPEEPAWLSRLAKAKGTHSMSDFAANEIARYVRVLREAAWPIVRSLESVGDDTNWVQGDETDRVYPWYEIEPLKKAVLG